MAIRFYAMFAAIPECVYVCVCVTYAPVVQITVLRDLNIILINLLTWI